MAIQFQLFSLSNVLTSFQNLGFFQLLFPFLLALAIIYGVLSKVASDWLPKSARGLVSIIISFFVMLFAAQNPAIVGFYTILGGVGLIIASVALVLIVLMGMVGLNFKELWKEGKGKHWLAVLVIVFILFLLFSGFTGAAGLINLPSFITGSDFWGIIIFIIILALVFWWLKSDDEGGGHGGKPAAAAH